MVYDISIIHLSKLESYLRLRRNAAVALAGAIGAVAILLSFVLHI